MYKNSSMIVRVAYKNGCPHNMHPHFFAILIANFNYNLNFSLEKTIENFEK